MKKGGIYAIRNTSNGKAYIGSAVDLIGRKRTHFGTLRRNVHYNKHLQNAFNKHGEQVFVFEVLEYVEDNGMLITREQYWLDATVDKYNIRHKAESNLGLVTAESTKELIRAKKLGVPRPADMVLRITGPNHYGYDKSVYDKNEGDIIQALMDGDSVRSVARRFGASSSGMGFYVKILCRRYPDKASAFSSGNKGTKHSEKSRQKMAKARQGSSRLSPHLEDILLGRQCGMTYTDLAAIYRTSISNIRHFVKTQGAA